MVKNAIEQAQRTTIRLLVGENFIESRLQLEWNMQKIRLYLTLLIFKLLRSPITKQFKAISFWVTPASDGNDRF